jgi:hypothetical protein
VILIAAALIVLYLFPLFICFSPIRLFSLFNKITFFRFVIIFVILSWIGGKPVTDLFVLIGQIFRCAYFLWFCFIFYTIYFLNKIFN